MRIVYELAFVEVLSIEDIQTASSIQLSVSYTNCKRHLSIYVNYRILICFMRPKISNNRNLISFIRLFSKLISHIKITR